MTEISQTITDKAGNVKSIRTDGVEVQQRDLRELVEADKHVQKQAAANAGIRSIQFLKINRPGAL